MRLSGYLKFDPTIYENKLIFSLLTKNLFPEFIYFDCSQLVLQLPVLTVSLNLHQSAEGLDRIDRVKSGACSRCWLKVYSDFLTKGRETKKNNFFHLNLQLLDC